MRVLALHKQKQTPAVARSVLPVTVCAASQCPPAFPISPCRDSLPPLLTTCNRGCLARALRPARAHPPRLTGRPTSAISVSTGTTGVTISPSRFILIASGPTTPVAVVSRTCHAAHRRTSAHLRRHAPARHGCAGRRRHASRRASGCAAASRRRGVWGAGEMATLLGWDILGTVEMWWCVGGRQTLGPKAT
jgi:hypothetical protein